MANNRNDLTKTINQLHPGDIAVLRNGFVPGRSISDIYDRTSGKFTTVGGPGSPYGALQTQIQSQENLAKAFKENAKLYESINGEEKKQYGEIAKKGLILTEYVVGTKPLPEHFPARNRIISGLSNAIIVIEAGKNSGALITVDYALQEGKNIYAVPGNIDSKQSEGTNQLLKEGAILYTGFHDLQEN